MHGYALYGFDMLYRATGDKRYYDFIKRYIDKHIDENGNFRVVVDGRQRERPTGFTNLDNMMTGNTVVMLYEYTKDPRYKKAADTIRRALDDYPRNNDGGFWHARGMHGPDVDRRHLHGPDVPDPLRQVHRRHPVLLGRSHEADDRLRQTRPAGRHGTLPARRLRAGARRPGVPLGGPETGLSPEVWSEGLGWYALVMVETLADLPKNHAKRGEMEDIFRRLAAGLKRTQDPKSGRWFQVVDKGDRPDNWTDTSGSAMFTYTIQKGIEIGLLDKAEYAPVVTQGYQGIIGNAKINDKGLVDIYSACDGVGVQVSYDRYINYKKSINAKEAVAGFLWATAIVERPQLEKLRKE